MVQEKALDLEDKLHKKEQEVDGHAQQLPKVSQVEEDLAMPRPEAVEDLKIEVRDSIMTIQHLVETHKLRTAEVSGRCHPLSLIRTIGLSFLTSGVCIILTHLLIFLMLCGICLVPKSRCVTCNFPSLGKACINAINNLVVGASLAREVLEEMSESIAACIRQCQQAQREGTAAADIITSDQSALASFSKTKLTEKWHTVIEARFNLQSHRPC